MHFDDQSGPVTLPVVSNSPPIDATGDRRRRPIRKLEIQQLLDARRLVFGIEDRAVTLEVQAKGEGVIPDIHDLLVGLDDDIAMAEHAIRLLEDPELVRRLTTAGHAELTRYRWPAVREKWLDMYQRLVPATRS